MYFAAIASSRGVGSCGWLYARDWLYASGWLNVDGLWNLAVPLSFFMYTEQRDWVASLQLDHLTSLVLLSNFATYILVHRWTSGLY